MLLQFTVDNYKSFGGTQVFSMMALPDGQHLAGQVVELPVGKVLRVAGIYGANASGKSNFLDGWRAFATLAREGVRPGDSIEVEGHAFAAPGASTGFAVELWAGAQHWAYGIRVTRDQVVAEWLEMVDGESRVVWFRRDADGTTWGEAAPEERLGFLRFVAEGTRPEQPLLAELRERSVEEVGPVLEALELRAARFGMHDLLATAGRLGSAEATFTWSIARDPSLAEDFAEDLSALGTGVDAIRLRGHDVLASEKPQAWMGLIQKQQVSVEFQHSKAGKARWFRWDQLSTGTQRLVALLMQMVATPEVPVWIDEVGQSLHAAATRRLLRMHLGAEHGDFERAQLIFTTHDTRILDSKLLPPESIWFVEKDADASSTMHSLADFEPGELGSLAQDGGLERAYLDGRFGGVPRLGRAGRVP